MDTYDIKKALPALYAPKPGDCHVVEVPDLPFLVINGHGDPNVSPAVPTTPARSSHRSAKWTSASAPGSWVCGTRASSAALPAAMISGRHFAT